VAKHAGERLRLDARSRETDAGIPYAQFSSFTHAARELNERSPPFVQTHYEALGDWIAAGGLDWHAKHNTPPWKRVCGHLEDCLSAAAEWDRSGRPALGRQTPDPPPRSGPVVPDGIPEDSAALRTIRENNRRQREGAQDVG
jgi:hypothetical protein